MERILFADNKKLAESQIKTLEERRRENGELLEAARQKIAKVMDEEPLLDDVIEWLELSDYEVMEKAMELCLSRESTSLNVTAASAIAAEIMPDLVQEVEAAVRAARGRSEDPVQYWKPTKQAFAPIPVTKTEKETIYARARRYVADNPQLRAFIDECQRRAAYYTYGNRWLNADINPARLNELEGRMARAYRITSPPKPPGVATQYYHEIEFDPDPWLQREEEHQVRLFDEDKQPA